MPVPNPNIIPTPTPRQRPKSLVKHLLTVEPVSELNRNRLERAILSRRLSFSLLRGLQLQSPWASANAFPVHFDQHSHSDRSNDCIEKNRPDARDESILAHVRRLVVSDFDDQESDFPTRDHRRPKKESGQPHRRGG